MNHSTSVVGVFSNRQQLSTAISIILAMPLLSAQALTESAPNQPAKTELSKDNSVLELGETAVLIPTTYKRALVMKKAVFRKTTASITVQAMAIVTTHHQRKMAFQANGFIRLTAKNTRWV